MKAQAFPEALLGLLHVAEVLLGLRDLAEARRHPTLLAELALDLERLFKAAERFFRPIKTFVGDADRLKDVGARLVVFELDGQGETCIQMFERALRIAAADFHAAKRAQAVHEFGIELDDLREALPRFVERAAPLVEAAQIELHRRAIGRRLGEVLEGLDGLRDVVHDPVVVRRDQVFLLRWQRLAQAHGTPRELAGLGVVAECRERLGQAGKRQREIAVGFGSRLETLQRRLLLALAGQRETLVVQPQRLEGGRRRFPCGGLQLVEDVRRSARQTLAHSAREFGDRGQQAALVRRHGVEWHRLLALEILQRRVDANGVPESRVLAPQHALRAREVGDARQLRGGQRGIRCDAEILEHLVQPIRRHRSYPRRLSELGAQHFAQARSERIERRIP